MSITAADIYSAAGRAMAADHALMDAPLTVEIPGGPDGKTLKLGTLVGFDVEIDPATGKAVLTMEIE